MKNVKKLLCLLLALMMVFTLFACAADDSSDDDDDDDDDEETTEETKDEKETTEGDGTEPIVPVAPSQDGFESAEALIVAMEKAFAGQDTEDIIRQMIPATIQDYESVVEENVEACESLMPMLETYLTNPTMELTLVSCTPMELTATEQAELAELYGVDADDLQAYETEITQTMKGTADGAPFETSESGELNLLLIGGRWYAAF